MIVSDRNANFGLGFHGAPPNWAAFAENATVLSNMTLALAKFLSCQRG
jgi:hypothetical protein